MSLDIVEEFKIESEKIPPAVIKNKMLEILEGDPWNKLALKTLSELEFGDTSRLYRLDALRSDCLDDEYAANLLIWEVNEEIMPSRKRNLQRLSSRLSKVMKIILKGRGDSLEDYCNITEMVITELLSRNKTEQVILFLKSSLLLENKASGIVGRILSMNRPCTKTVIIELLRDKGSVNDNLKIELLSCIATNPFLFTDLKIRQTVSKSFFQLGFLKLSFHIAMKSIEINPQDQISAIIALDSAIRLGEDEKTLLAAGIVLSMKKEPKGIDYTKIAAAAVRKGRFGYAKDLLLRRRMKLDLAGHRLRVGIPFHEEDIEGVFEEIERTPKPFSEHDSIKTYRTMALISGRIKRDSVDSIKDIGDPLERDLLKYHLSHFNEDFNGAMWAINSHFSKNGMATIRQKWAESKCDFLKIETDKSGNKDRNRGKVSVIMTCHKNNDALELAVNSIFDQSYPNVQFIFVDDFSPKSDVEEYDRIFEGREVTRIRMPVNSGTYACRNEGLKIADGDFITFADSDDWVNPKKISNSIDFLLRENADLVVGRYVRMRFDGGIVWNGIRFARFALMGMTFRAAALKQVLGGFDSRSRHSADSEIFERARILLGERKVVRYPTIEIIALESGSNLTSEGGLAIDWVGTSGERVRYAESYRKWHGSIKNDRRNARRRAFGFRIEGEPLDDVEKMLEDRYDVVQENFTENNRSKDLRDDPILVTMCTYPGGFGTVAESLNHLLNNQTVPISKLILTVNGGELPEDLPDDTRLEVKLSKSDVTDKGKFIEIKDHEGYVITTDDDIQYPEDYVEKMIDHVDEFDREYLIGVHGAHLPEGPGVTRWWEYMNYRRSLVFPQEMPTFIPVNVIGTGTLAFHTSLGVPNPKKFDYQRMVDLHLAVWAQKNRIPMVICPRRRDWLKEIKATYVGRIWDTVKDDSRLQHQMLEVLQRSERWTIHARRDWGKFSNSGVYSKFGEWGSRELPAGMTLAKNTMEFSRLSDRPLVTIYMPAFNCEEYVIESINSALNQSYTNIEICIHDDGSTDRTLSLIKKKFRFNRRVRISSGNNGGIGHASNSAIRNGKGDLILQLDSDDILEPDAIEKLLPGMGRDIVCSYGSFIRIDGAGEKIDDGWDWPIYSHPRIMRSMIIHHPRLFRREGWEKIGGFDCDLENGVDYDFFLRLAEIGNFYHTSEKLYSYRIHDHSTSQEKYDLQTKNTYLVQKRALERMNITEFTNFAPNPDFPRRIHYSFAAFRNRKGSV